LGLLRAHTLMAERFKAIEPYYDGPVEFRCFSSGVFSIDFQKLSGSDFLVLLQLFPFVINDGIFPASSTSVKQKVLHCILSLIALVGMMTRRSFTVAELDDLEHQTSTVPAAHTPPLFVCCVTYPSTFSCSASTGVFVKSLNSAFTPLGKQSNGIKAALFEPCYLLLLFLFTAAFPLPHPGVHRRVWFTCWPRCCSPRIIPHCCCERAVVQLFCSWG